LAVIGVGGAVIVQNGPMAIWQTDVLGADWVRRDLSLPRGAIATLVRRARPLDVDDDVPQPRSAEARPAVLYLHGFVDYFFHPHVAAAFEAHGYPFYALDLRGYGRSIGRGVEPGGPNYVPDISVYAQDLDAARAAIREEGHTALVLVGHSTGGLIGSLWADARPGSLHAMILNSPWLELNENWFARGPLTALISVIGAVAPKLRVSGLWPYYGQALHKDSGGEWNYDLAWKPHRGFPVSAGWFASVRRAQRRVRRGLDVDCPVLVAMSARRGPNRRAHPDVLTTDSVLDPAQIWALAPKLGPHVERIMIADGAHDLALSPAPARDDYLGAAVTWLDDLFGESPEPIGPA
jgi:alpha-beta hydrolase superfamily lysophospholipase